MTPHRTRDSLAAGLAPICSSGTDAIVHLYAGVSSGAVIAATLIATALTGPAAVVPQLPDLITARSKARVPLRVLAKMTSHADAALINEEANLNSSIDCVKLRGHGHLGNVVSPGAEEV